MQALYKTVGISRQGFHHYLKNKSLKAAFEQQVVQRVQDFRLDHPRMGARPLYAMMQLSQQDQTLIQDMGRDQLEQILFDNDLYINPVKVFHKTTYAGSFRFPNLVEGLSINGLNQIWVSDLTYYRLTQDWAYLTFIMDLYSRRILGYALAQTLVTEQTTLPALNMALKNRGRKDFQKQLTFHSDGGGQFYDNNFIDLLNQFNINSSMAEIVFENPHSERLNGIAKNDYLIPWGVNSLSQLQKALPKFVRLYNEQRPHGCLKMKTPLAFELWVEQLPVADRPQLLFKKVT